MLQTALLCGTKSEKVDVTSLCLPVCRDLFPVLLDFLDFLLTDRISRLWFTKNTM